MAHSVSSRTHFQTSRPGWRPRKRSRAQLINDIVASIRRKQAAGQTWKMEQYTQDKSLHKLIREALGYPEPEPLPGGWQRAITTPCQLRPVQTTAVQAKRQKLQGWIMSGCRTAPLPTRPCDDCGTPTTARDICPDCYENRYRWAEWEESEEQYAWEITHGCA